MLALLLAAAAACSNHQFDFWLGKWDLVVRSRTSTSEWVESKGRNEITPSYGGCVVEERFTCDTPNGTFAGHSVTAFARGKWHQTWVDNQGAYLVFDGGWTGAEMVLVQEGGQKRMVFTRISPDALHWRWEKTDDGGKTWTPILLIDYRRAG
jgi:hypothetical protein